jgi:hypothetical protein
MEQHPPAQGNVMRHESSSTIETAALGETVYPEQDRVRTSLWMIWIYLAVVVVWIYTMTVRMVLSLI